MGSTTFNRVFNMAIYNFSSKYLFDMINCNLHSGV